MNICVFCSGQEVRAEYEDAARDLGRRIGKGGHGLVWGGSNVGLMRVIADAVQENGGRITGVSVEFLREKARANADEMIIAKDLNERKNLLSSKSDAIVTLPGGTGTLDEISEIFELKKHNFYSKPVVILNTDGFYDGLRQQLQRMKDEGFIVGPLENYVHFAATPAEALGYLEKHGASS